MLLAGETNIILNGVDLERNTLFFKHFVCFPGKCNKNQIVARHRNSDDLKLVSKLKFDLALFNF